MNDLRKYFSSSLLAGAALLGASSTLYAATPTLATAAKFAVLGGTNVTCTSGIVAGAIAVAPGSAVPFTNTGCTIAGAVPPATDAAAAQARTDFLAAYAALQLGAAACLPMPGDLAGQNLAPGVYCTDAVAKAGTLTLTGPADGVWIFLVDGALTGTGFSVIMDGGGQPCNVFWAPSAAATLTTSAFKGNILAGDAALGSITLTGGTLAGSALANVAVTMTDANVIGCGALSGSGSSSCPDKHHHDDDDEDDENHHHKGNKDKDHHGKGKDKDGKK